MAYDIPTMVSEATGVLKSLIAIPSLSRDEEKAADYLQNYIELQGMATGRKGNNVWCLSPMFDLNKPTLLLNSHIDTAVTMDEMIEKFQENRGFIKAMWCGDEACEQKLKDDAGVSSRCIPFEQEHLSDVCVCCGKPAKHMIYWGVAY